MNIIIPMAGAGSRFTQKGYSLHKPILPITSRHNLLSIPMVVEAVRDLPIDLNDINTCLLFIMREFHMVDEIDKVLLEYFPRAKFIIIDNLTAGQASTCLYAREYFDTNKPLMIAACDNGMDLPDEGFLKASENFDSLIFTFRGNDAVKEKPEAYGWVRTNKNAVKSVSIKKKISDNPTDDHAIVGTFWFRRGSDFFKSVDQMIEKDDRINGEFYVDQVFKYLLNNKQNIGILEVDKYLCWGTPKDYEAYEATIEYWSKYILNEKWAK
ncbi:hypothetical protein N9535_03230 [Amylibacter sp.]|nr:hypothetical protein [Amylibacter sp.]MDB4095668.1 hypothetical protein [Amylibacter sp.]